ncbi:MAG TPA: ROK family protein [Acidobacteriaceae bacterium]|jgi:glucokinase
MTLLGLDLGGSHATCSLIHGKSVVAEEHLSFAESSSFAAVEPAIRDCLQRVARVSAEPVSGLGIGFAGLADFRSNRVISTNGKYEDAPEFDFNAWAQNAFGIPARIENDARLALRGEMYAGAAQGANDVVMFTLGTGIGGVVAMGGQPFVGTRGQAGVLGGHVPVREGGRPCTCGGIGCAEAEAGGWALPGICCEWPGFAESFLADQPLNFKSLFEQSAAGDRVATEIFEHCLTVWAMMTVAAVHTFDPDLIVFGGGVMQSGDRILPFIKSYVERYTWTRWNRPIVAAALGNKAAALGVPTLFQEGALNVR